MDTKHKGRYLIGLIFLLAVILSGCQSAATTTPAGDQPAPATSAPDEPAKITGSTGSFFEINEVGLRPEGFVALTNFTDVDVSLGNLYLCQGSSCFALPEKVVMAGETVRIAVGNGSGLENVVATHATFGELRPADGEIALYDSQHTDDPESMLIYFQWGSTPHDLTDIAIEAGIWVEGGYGPSGENAIRLYRDLDSGLWLWDQSE